MGYEVWLSKTIKRNTIVNCKCYIIYTVYENNFIEYLDNTIILNFKDLFLYLK